MLCCRGVRVRWLWLLACRRHRRTCKSEKIRARTGYALALGIEKELIVRLDRVDTLESASNRARRLSFIFFSFQTKMWAGSRRQGGRGGGGVGDVGI